VVIDYAHRRLSCYPLQAGKAAKRAPFVRTDSLPEGKPVVRGYIGQTPVQLVLDTGQSISLDLAFVQQIGAAQRPRLVGERSPTRVSGVAPSRHSGLSCRS
jgi:hypothetical protein